MFCALLRGINVGGNNKIQMSVLKQTFERLGFTKVQTYINSGNVIFESTHEVNTEVRDLIEHGIHEEFEFKVDVLVLSKEEMNTILALLPSHWMNNSEMKSDVMFLMNIIASKSLIDSLPINTEIIDVIHGESFIAYSLPKEHYVQSRINKIIGTNAYKNSTVRNINTVRKLCEILNN